MRLDIVVLSSAEVLATADDLAALYGRVFGAPGYDEPPESAQRFRTEQLPKHVEREGFRFVAAMDGGRFAGFAYGYTGRRGQWWSDHVAALAPAEITETWVGGHFEFVELAVDPVLHGKGIGTALHDALLTGLPHHRALLTTYRDDRPATRLYRRRGWRVLVAELGEDSALYGIKLGGG